MAPKVTPPHVRFARHVRHLDNGCMEWTAYRGGNGYGRFYVDGRNALAHRWVYEQIVGEIPPGLQIDHLCRNRGCVNPEHLEAVTPAENTRRSSGPALASARAAARTHCREGHELTLENTYENGGARQCRRCKRAKAREHYEANRGSYIERAARWRRRHPEEARKSSRESHRRLREARRARNEC